MHTETQTQSNTTSQHTATTAASASSTDPIPAGRALGGADSPPPHLHTWLSFQGCLTILSAASWWPAGVGPRLARVAEGMTRLARKTGARKEDLRPGPVGEPYGRGATLGQGPALRRAPSPVESGGRSQAPGHPS